MPRVFVALLLFAIAIEPAIMEGSGPKKGKTGKKVTISGCLVETEGRFTITDEHHSGEFLLMTSGAFEVRAHVGHVISVTGRTVADDGYVLMDGDKGTQDQLIGIKVESVRTIKEICEVK